MNEFISFLNNYSGVINLALVAALFGIVFRLYRMALTSKEGQIELLKQQIILKDQFSVENVPEKFRALKEYYEVNMREWYEVSLKAIREEKEKLSDKNEFRKELDIEASKRKEVLDRYLDEKSNDVISTHSLKANDICGTYNIIGHNPQTPLSTYSGELTISNMGKIFLANWIIGPNKQKHEGIGIAVGNSIAFTYKSDLSNINMLPQIGVVLYELISSNVLRGEWTSHQDHTTTKYRSSLGYEECRKL